MRAMQVCKAHSHVGHIWVGAAMEVEVTGKANAGPQGSLAHLWNMWVGGAMEVEVTGEGNAGLQGSLACGTHVGECCSSFQPVDLVIFMKNSGPQRIVWI